MKKILPFALIFTVALVLFARFNRLLPRLHPHPQQQAQPEAQATKAPEFDADHAVTLVGPLANYMQRTSPAAPVSSVEPPPPPRSSSTDPSDHVSSAPLGSSGTLIRRNFILTGAAHFSFDIPPHSNSPRLTGTYRASSSDSGSPASVDFLVLTADQYAALPRGLGDAFFSAPASQHQDVDLALPITADAPVRYYVVFRSNEAHTRKIVNADLRLEL